jgi:hypothetical protein
MFIFYLDKCGTRRLWSIDGRGHFQWEGEPNQREPFAKFVDSSYLLLRVGTLWRCGDSLFFEVRLLASDALLTTLHPLVDNVLQTVDRFDFSCLGAPFSWLEKPRNRVGRDLNWILRSAWKQWIGGTPLEHPPYSPDLAHGHLYP